MNAELTDKTMVVISRLGDFWVTPARAKKIMQTKQQDPSGSIEFDGCLIACNCIDGVISPAQYEMVNLKRRGAWQCKYRWWHERGQQCAHEKFNTSDRLQ